MKENLIEEIKKLPQFELKEIAVKDENRYIENEYLDAVIEKGNPELILSVVSKRYKLVQFEEVFTPAIEKIEKIKDFFVDYYKGKAIVEIYPDGEDFEIENGRIGIALRNSVNKMLAIRIDFVINLKNMPSFILPLKRIKGLRKVHKGNINVIKDYLDVIGNVKETWKRIVDEFQEFKVDLSDFFEKVNVGKRIENKIRKYFENKLPNLWEIFVTTIKEIGERKYKSELNKKEKLERISKAILDYALVLSI